MGPGCSWNKPAHRPPFGLGGQGITLLILLQQVEDERSDREETESSEGEEAAAGGAKSRPLANGHPILNNHRKND